MFTIVQDDHAYSEESATAQRTPRSGGVQTTLARTNRPALPSPNTPHPKQRLAANERMAAPCRPERSKNSTSGLGISPAPLRVLLQLPHTPSPPKVFDPGYHQQLLTCVYALIIDILVGWHSQAASKL